MFSLYISYLNLYLFTSFFNYNIKRLIWNESSKKSIWSLIWLQGKRRREATTSHFFASSSIKSKLSNFFSSFFGWLSKRCWKCKMCLNAGIFSKFHYCKLAENPAFKHILVLKSTFSTSWITSLNFIWMQNCLLFKF